MNRRRGTWQFCLAWIVTWAAPSFGLAQVPCATQSPHRLHYGVRVPAEMASGISVAAQPAVQFAYDRFSWMLLDQPQVDILAATGIDFELQPDPYVLRLGEVSFDPMRDPFPSFADGWNTVGTIASDLQLVQFKGPTKAEWLDALANVDIQVVQYIHPFTYIVWGSPAALATAAQQFEVRWTGPFIPGFRVRPHWHNLSADNQRVRALVYRGAGSHIVADEIRRLGARSTGRRVLNDTFEIIGFELPGNRMREVACIPGVYSVRPEPTDGGLRGEMSNQVSAGNVDAMNVALHGYMFWLAAIGLDGSGIIMANVDGGIEDSHPDLSARLLSCFGASCGGPASDPHGTHTAAIMAGDASSLVQDGSGYFRGLGMAPGADLIEQLYFPTFLDPGGMHALMTDSWFNGAVLSNNSWGPSGTPQGYDDDTMQVDIGVRDAHPGFLGNQSLSFILSFMNGFGGFQTQGTPDEGKNLFTIGSTKMQTSQGPQSLDINDLSSNTAHGPALDGRTIPHLVAPGCWVDSATTGGTYDLNCGTSMAAPHVSGAIALFIEYYRSLPNGPSDPSPALIKAAFTAAASSLAGFQDADGAILGHPFDSKQGWGRMEAKAVLDPVEDVRYFDNPMLLSNTGEEWSTNVSPADPTKPMRIMLVWTDAPGHGLGGSTPAWNNDLDLVVEVGTDSYKGNSFDVNGWSSTSGSADTKNNTEGVFLGPTAPLSATIRVVAANINSDGVPGVGSMTDQDFAVACYNCAIGAGFSISADPSTLDICAPDEAAYSVFVMPTSSFSDPVSLSATGTPPGTTVLFDENPVIPPSTTTMRVLNTGGAAPGRYAIEINGAAAPLMRSASVELNLASAPPGTPVLVVPLNGAIKEILSPTLVWTAATRAVSYEVEIATDPLFLGLVDQATGLRSTSYSPPPLDTLTAYYWRVRAVNECGTSTSDAFVFTTLDAPPILLVDDDDNSPDVRSFYTDILDAGNLGYAVWDTNNSDNEPDLSILSQHTIVIWFTGESFGGFCGPGPDAEAALSQFLDAGNCVFFSSQDYLFDRGLTFFLANYAGIGSFSSDVTQISVVGSGPNFDGLGPYSLSYPFVNYSDEVSPDATAQLAFIGGSGDAGIQKDNGTYRTVFLGFPLEAIPSQSDRADILAEVTDFCTPVPNCITTPGDMNAGGDVNGRDISQFVNCFLNGDPASPGCPCADMNQSGAFEMEDVSAFVDCLLQISCP